MFERFKQGLTPYTAGLVQALGDAAIIVGGLVRSPAYSGRSEGLIFSKVYSNIADRFIEACDKAIAIGPYPMSAEVLGDEVVDEDKRARFLAKATMGYVEGMCQALRQVADIQEERTRHMEQKGLTYAITVLASDLTGEYRLGMPFMGGNSKEAYLTAWPEAYNHAAWKLMDLEDPND